MSGPGATRNVQLLLIEDSAGDARLTQEAFRDANVAVQLHVVSDGAEAMEFLQREGRHALAPRPDLILLDLNLPGLDGRDVLAFIKGSESLKSIPTVVLTSSREEEDIDRSYRLHANCYITKPAKVDELWSLVKGINEFWLTSRTGTPAERRSPRRLLVVEDSPGDARLLREMLLEESAQDITVIEVASMREAEKYLSENPVDIIILDLGLPDARGVEAVRRARAVAPRVPLVVLTGLDDEAMAGLALQEGAQDYLIKSQIETRGLLRALRYSIERKFLEDALFVEKERAQVTLNSIGDAVISTDSSGNITFLNRVAEQMTGWSRQEAELRPVADVFRIVGGAADESAAKPGESAVDLDRTVRLPASAILVRRDGTETPIEDSVAPIHDREGNETGSVMVFRDVSQARAMAREMAHSAEHDFLTGLPNRLLLSDRVSQAITLAERHRAKLAVLFLDLDGFKHVNDSLGHPIGDELLKSIAKRLVSCVRNTDTVSRQGGDEFVVLLSEVEHVEDAAITARRMLQLVAEVHTIDLHDLFITTSIGVSVYPDDGVDADTLIKNADTAMYQAKENGRQSYQFFKPAMNIRAVERQSIEESLRSALENEEFAVHYQPIVDLATGKITGAEALIRWTHPTRGLVAPATFIPVAEDCGLILSIGNWVLREACRQAGSWLKAGLPLGTMAVNISAMEFRNEAFVDGIFTALRETGLDPAILELELTESALMKRAESAGGIIRALRAGGVRLAVDDFGTGYSSLSHLGKFQVDALKIDQSFVRQITAAADEASIVTAVIRMGHSLKLRVVAEGVETREELAFLKAHDCDAAQGYYFGRPMPAPHFAKLLETGGVAMTQLRIAPGAALPASAAGAGS